MSDAMTTSSCFNCCAALWSTARSKSSIFRRLQLKSSPPFQPKVYHLGKLFKVGYFQVERVFFELAGLCNHVHAELDLSVQLPTDWQAGQTPASYTPLHKIVNLIKGGSARYINRLLGQTGTPLWSITYRDRFIRGERHLENACRYTKNNAVAAQLVDRWEDHPFSGGMTAAEMADRRQRRVYPDAGLWIKQLRDFDERRK